MSQLGPVNQHQKAGDPEVGARDAAIVLQRRRQATTCARCSCFCSCLRRLLRDPTYDASPQPSEACDAAMPL